MTLTDQQAKGIYTRAYACSICGVDKFYHKSGKCVTCVRQYRTKRMKENVKKQVNFQLDRNPRALVDIAEYMQGVEYESLPDNGTLWGVEVIINRVRL